METSHRRFLTEHLVIISSQSHKVIPEYLTYLLSKRLLSVSTLNDILCKTTETAQLLQLYLSIIRGGPQAFPEFMKAIKIYNRPLFNALTLSPQDREIVYLALA